MTAATPESSSVSVDRPPPVLLKRPCLLVAVFLIPGIVLGHYVLPKELTAGLLAAPAACFLLAAVLIAAHSSFSTPVSMLAVFGVGALLGIRSGLLPPEHVHFRLEPGETYRLRGIVASDPIPASATSWRGRGDKERLSFTLEAKRIIRPTARENAPRAITGKILVYTSAVPRSDLEYGDSVELTGEIFLPQSQRNPGGFDFRKYLAQNGIHVCMQADALRRLGRGHGHPVLQLLHWLRKRIRHSFSESKMPPERESFLRAVVLGERKEVGEEFKEALRRTNTTHILAISGLHVGILAGAMYFFLSRLLFVPQGVSSAATIIVLLGYALLTGMRPPVMRASLMCTAFLMAPLLRKRLDAINSLAFAAVVILFIRAGDLFTAGFQLSFAVVLSILLLSNKIFHGLVSAFHLRPDPGFLTVSPLQRRVYRVLEYPLRLFAVALAAFLGSLPLTLFYFHHICFLSPVCNMAVIPLVGLIVPLGFLAGVVGFLARGAVETINAVNSELIWALQSTVRFLSGVRLASFNVSPPSPAFCFAFYSMILLIGFGRRFRRLLVPLLLILALTTTLFLGGVLERRHPDSLKITFLDVGQGDCTFVEFPDGRRMLLDGGSQTRYGVGRYVIVPFLRWSGVNKLDAVLVTHYDADHMNGLESVFENIGTRTVVVRAGPKPPDTITAKRLLEAIERNRIRRAIAGAGDRLPVSPRVRAEILNPPGLADLSRLSENDLSIVLKLAFRGSSALLCGDIEKKTEEMLLHGPVSVRSDVLKVPHHGSNSSSSGGFIRQVSPKLGIISCGERSPYGHPSPAVLERYAQLGVRVFRTDRDGGIVVRVFEDRLTVTTTR